MTSRSRGTRRPSLVRVRPRKREGAGNAGCALHRRSRAQWRVVDARMSIRAQRRHPASPASWFYGLCRALPGDEFVLSPSSADASDTSTRSGQTCHRRLGTSNGCQDHTVLPYAQTSFVLRAFQIAHEVQLALRPPWRADAVASTTSRPAFVTTRDRPSCRNGTAGVKPLIWGFSEAESCPSCHLAATRRPVVSHRHCERKRSNPWRNGGMDCFVAIAPRNDG